MRLVDADELYQKLHEAGGCGASKGSWADGWDKAIDEAIRIVTEAPSIMIDRETAIPVLNQSHSKIPEDIEYNGEEALYGKCPRCGELLVSIWTPSYCGDCGQKIKWEENDHEPRAETESAEE